MAEQLNKFRSQNSTLNIKNAQLSDELEKKKKEITLLRKSSAMKKKGEAPEMELKILPGKNPNMVMTSSMRPHTPIKSEPIDHSADLLNVAKKLKEE